MVIKYGMEVSMTEFMFQIQWFLKYFVFPPARVLPLWQYWQNFEPATWWHDGIIIDPNHSYGHKIWYGSLHDRIYDPIQWF